MAELSCKPQQKPAVAQPLPTAPEPAMGGAGSVMISGPVEVMGTVNVVTDDHIVDVENSFICMIDKDGNNLTPYVIANQTTIRTQTGATTVLLGNFTDESLATPYTVVGTPCLASDVGVFAETKQHRVCIEDGATWQPNPLVESYTIRVVTGAPTYTDSDGNTTTMVVGEVSTFERHNDAFDTAPVLITAPGDKVIITYTELGA